MTDKDRPVTDKEARARLERAYGRLAEIRPTKGLRAGIEAHIEQTYRGRGADSFAALLAGYGVSALSEMPDADLMLVLFDLMDQPPAN